MQHRTNSTIKTSKWWQWIIQNLCRLICRFYLSETRPPWRHGDFHTCNVGPPVDSVQLVNITTISRLGFMVVITIVRWGYVHQLITFGGPHIDRISPGASFRNMATPRSPGSFLRRLTVKRRSTSLELRQLCGHRKGLEEGGTDTWARQMTRPSWMN